MKVAVVGATGLVGREMLKVLAEENFPVSTLIPVASPRSAGSQIEFGNKSWTVVTLEKAVEMRPEIAIFSAGGSVSKEWAPRFAEVGCTVIDNSSAWRMEPEIPLVVPEINLETARGKKIIANPNCSTIQLVMALAPLHRRYGIKRLVVSTYQSVSGTGKEAVEQLFSERGDLPVNQVYPHPIDLNCIPHCDVFLENDYTREEMKVVNETRKILNDYEIAITCTAVRVPVIGGHSEAVNIEFKQDFDLNEVRKLLAAMPGVVIADDPASNIYPMPALAHGKNEVFVGRIRRDPSIPYGLNLWVVADNLRKGAATNAVQIAQGLFVSANSPA
ncbi:MAG: aspartate-semialdehyde dehydrogenase [Bacteroidia bacterium]|nr:aspartate-semialdehyde dehydrogenase [Bacteroidia bacterium]